jgi:hypothetical protein
MIMEKMNKIVSENIIMKDGYNNNFTSTINCSVKSTGSKVSKSDVLIFD